MAAAFPVLLSFAISPGLGQPFLVLGIFLVLDLTTANAIEPLIFGHSTGVSPWRCWWRLFSGRGCGAD